MSSHPNPPSLSRRKNQWVVNVLLRSGRYLGERRRGVYDFEVHGRLREILGRSRVTLTFLKGEAEDGVELAAPGSWFHDQLLGYSEEWGSVSRLHLRSRPDFDREALLAKSGLGPPRELKQRRYLVLLRYSFRVVYYTAPLVQELISLIYDPVRNQVYKRPFAQAFLDEAVDVPEPGVVPGFLPNPDKGFAPVWEAVSGEVDKRVERMQAEQMKGHEDTMGSLKRYYRQLIEDEGGGRAKDAGDAREKTELLKLEWQRRVNEEMEQLKPQVGASLVTLAGLHIPAEQWTLGGRKAAWLDPVRGLVLARAPRKAKDGGR